MTRTAPGHAVTDKGGAARAYLDGAPYDGRVTGRAWPDNIILGSEGEAHAHAERFSRAYPGTVVYLWPTGTGNYAVNAGTPRTD